MIERYASLVLAEKIAKGEAFNEGMEVVLFTKPPRAVKATKEVIETAAKTALERHEHGYELDEHERQQVAKTKAKKTDEKPGKQGG